MTVFSATLQDPWLGNNDDAGGNVSAMLAATYVHTRTDVRVDVKGSRRDGKNRDTRLNGDA